MKTRIHVNQHNIRSNARKLADPIYREAHGRGLEPVITVKDYKQNRKGFQAIITDGEKTVARVIYSPNNPLPCGAKVWVETELDVIVD